MDPIQRRARKRTAGEKLHGFELWRRLYWYHLDGEELSSIRGGGDFNQFPRCSSYEHLQAHVDEWLLLRDEVARGIPDANVLPMFLAILPKDYQDQLEEDPTVKTFQDAKARVTAKCRRLNQARLANLAQTKREAAIKGARASQSFVHSATPTVLNSHRAETKSLTSRRSLLR